MNQTLRSLRTSRTSRRSPLLRLAVTLGAGLLLGALIAVATYQLARTQLEMLFDARLADHGANVNDDMVALEREHLALLRSVVYTEGFADAMQRRDVSALQALATPLQANSDVPMVDIVDAMGMVILAVRGEGAPEPMASRGNWPVVQRVLAGERDELGERHAAIVVAAEGPLLVTAAPVKPADVLVGAVIVATPVADVIARAGGMLGLTVYDLSGVPLVTNLEYAPAPIYPDQAREIVAGSIPTRPRGGTMGTASYREVLGRLVVRGQGAAVLGVKLPDTMGAMALAIALAAGLTGAVTLIIALPLIRRLDVRAA